MFDGRREGFVQIDTQLRERLLGAFCQGYYPGIKPGVAVRIPAKLIGVD